MKSQPTLFDRPLGELKYMAAYAQTMLRWPVPYEGRYVSSRFGMTHVVVSGPKSAPPLVLLHGYLTSLTMWSANIAELSKNHRVYAVDVIGQPNKSIPDEPLQDRADVIEWLSSVFNALSIDNASVAGYSYGSWLAICFALGAPKRVKRLILLSPSGSFLRNAPQLTLRMMALRLFPTRFMARSFMRWLTFGLNLRDRRVRGLTDCLARQVHLGLKHFQMPAEAASLAPRPFSAAELRALSVPTLVLIGEYERLYDPGAALDRASRLIPNLQEALVSRASHDLPYSRARLVDALMLEFLEDRLVGWGSVGRRHSVAA